MTILVCGSLAFDTIMVFPDQFKNHILPDQIHILNVAFMVPDMRREFGGTAGNIGYNLKLLGEEPLVMATVGHDFGPYGERFAKLGRRSLPRTSTTTRSPRSIPARCPRRIATAWPRPTACGSRSCRPTDATA